MEHLNVGFAVVSTFVLCIYYKIIKINLNNLSKNAWNIVRWISCLMLEAVIVSWLR